MVYDGGYWNICMCRSFILFIILSLKYADASKLAPFSYFEIVTNIIIGYYFFSDFPDKWTFLGLFIIILSGIYISRRENIVKRLK